MSMTPARKWRSLVLPVTVTGVCGGLFALVYFFAVRTIGGRLVGDAALRFAISIGPGVNGMVDGVLDVISVASLLGSVAVIAVIALIRLRRGMGLAAIALMAGANVSAQLLKEFVLPRPDLGLHEIAPATLNSLPSGHSTAAFSAVVALLFVVPARLRVATAAAGVIYGCVTAVATMLAGWHRAADSMAAFLLVGVWVGLVSVAVVLLGESPAGKPRSGPAWRPGPKLAAAIAGLLTAGLALVLLLATDGSLRAGSVGRASALAALLLVLTASAGAVLVATVAVIDRIAPPASSHLPELVESRPA
jgi:membrane-associated phospholipid phosphatase